MQKQHGWSLAETMITLAMVGILAAMAVPAYRYYQNDVQLKQIQLTLLELQQAQHAYQLEHQRFAELTALKPVQTLAHFTLELENLSPSTFRLVAETQVGEAQCQRLTIDEAARRQPAECWQ